MLKSRQVRPHGKQFSFIKCLIITRTTLEDGCIVKDPDDFNFVFFYFVLSKPPTGFQHGCGELILDKAFKI